jgi:riboflavin-specific deaminase-like protein
MTGRFLADDALWQLLLALKGRASDRCPLTETCDVALDASGALRIAEPGEGWITLQDGESPSFRPTVPLSESGKQLMDLYLPLCTGRFAAAWTVAHVGQSLDGFIAIRGGESRYITGTQDVMHTHRMRALADAVVIGRRTVECDDPRLTTRLIPGQSPTRVVLDPSGRLDGGYTIFKDGDVATLVMCDCATTNGGRASQREIVRVASGDDGRFRAASVIAALRSRGLHRVFVEGGGVTVSEFLRQKALDRIHVTVAPLILGEGRRGISIPGVEHLQDALRPKARRFSFGQDVLFDCDLRS